MVAVLVLMASLFWSFGHTLMLWEYQKSHHLDRFLGLRLMPLALVGATASVSMTGIMVAPGIFIYTMFFGLVGMLYACFVTKSLRRRSNLVWS
jgi:hypothetical protein